MYGEEHLTKGVVSCMGEDAHVEGVFLRGVIAERRFRLVVEEETFIYDMQQLVAESDETAVECPLAARGCAGAQETFYWETAAAPCTYRHVTSAQGDRKSTRLNSSHSQQSRMPSSA